MSDATFTILLAGTMQATPRLRGQVAGTRVIAADSGITHAAALGLEVELTMPGLRDDGSRTQVLIDGVAHLVRGEGEVMHFCAAAALVMADRLLDDYGVAPRPPTAADLTELLTAAADTGYFPEIGCRTLVPA